MIITKRQEEVSAGLGCERIGAVNEMAKTLLVVGALIMVAGAALFVLGKMPWLGRLPGDIHFRKDGFSFYFPLASCVVLSLVLTLLFNVFAKK